jgi:hypothetical protein
MAQPQLGYGFCHTFRLAFIQSMRQAGADIAECTRTGADFPHDHHGSVAL